jgi:hypothetical protein
VRRENVNLRVTAEMAWLTFDQYGEDTADPDMDMPGLSRETRILEKHEGAVEDRLCGVVVGGVNSRDDSLAVEKMETCQGHTAGRIDIGCQIRHCLRNVWVCRKPCRKDVANVTIHALSRITRILTN